VKYARVVKQSAEQGQATVMLKSKSHSQKSSSESLTKKKSTILWAVIAMVSAFVSIGSWGLSSPIGSSPDDDYHNVSIWCGQGLREGLCEQGSEPGNVLVRETLKSNSFCFAGRSEESGYCEQTEALGETARTNRGENPNLFYWVNSWFASNDLVASVLAIRFFNTALAILLFASVIFALPRHLRRVPLVGIIATSVPLGLFIIPSTNPSSWASPSVLVFFSALAGFLSVKKVKSRWLLGGLAIFSAFIAAGSRPDSAFYILVSIGVALVISYTREMINLRSLAVVILLFAIAATFFLTAGNTGLTIAGAPGGGLQVTTIGKFFLNLVHLPNLWVGIFGSQGLGWMDTLMPSTVWAVAFGIYASIIFGAIKYFDSRQGFAVSLTFLSLIVVPMAALTSSGLLVGQFVQPRYLLPLLGLLVAASMYRRSDKSGFELSRAQVWLIAFGLVAAQLIALRNNMQRYLTGFGTNDIIEWWWVEVPPAGTVFWFSPDYVLLIGSIAFALLLVSLWKLRVELGLPGDSARKNGNTEDNEAVPTLQQVKPLRKRKIPWFTEKSADRKSQL
jgi:hypothetical protein